MNHVADNFFKGKRQLKSSRDNVVVVADVNLLRAGDEQCRSVVLVKREVSNCLADEGANSTQSDAIISQAPVVENFPLQEFFVAIGVHRVRPFSLENIKQPSPHLIVFVFVARKDRVAHESDKSGFEVCGDLRVG